jgi:hypothetical protein
MNGGLITLDPQLGRAFLSQESALLVFPVRDDPCRVEFPVWLEPNCIKSKPSNV